MTLFLPRRGYSLPGRAGFHCFRPRNPMRPTCEMSVSRRTAAQKSDQAARGGRYYSQTYSLSCGKTDPYISLTSGRGQVAELDPDHGLPGFLAASSYSSVAVPIRGTMTRSLGAYHAYFRVL